MSLSLQNPIIPQSSLIVNTFSNSYFSGDDIPNKKSLTKAMGDNLMLVLFDKLEFVIYNIYLYHRIRRLFSLHESFL